MSTSPCLWTQLRAMCLFLFFTVPAKIAFFITIYFEDYSTDVMYIICNMLRCFNYGVNNLISYTQYIHMHCFFLMLLLLLFHLKLPSNDKIDENPTSFVPKLMIRFHWTNCYFLHMRSLLASIQWNKCKANFLSVITDSIVSRALHLSITVCMCDSKPLICCSFSPLKQCFIFLICNLKWKRNHI